MKNKHPIWTKLDWRGARPLTLRELILKNNFDRMMEIIIANVGKADIKGLKRNAMEKSDEEISLKVN